MSKRWLMERKKDPYHRKAKRERYRSRASYKLIQLDDRFGILHDGAVVVDLGAAPGGWLQVARERVEGGLVLGLDLAGMEPMDGVVMLRGDMTRQKTVESLVETIKDGLQTGDDRPVDVVLSDMAPNISGNYSVDQAKSAYLAQKALDFAVGVLRSGGTVVIKVFQGEDFKELFDRVKRNFSFCKAHSPKASRSSSSEIYIVGKGFRGPRR